ncbi:sirohydrochlorin cobaltochelatase [Collinsella tanakaei]|nr:sirohydrochlorin cobaltochelatase [Collinsella tanakaei]
MDRWGLVIAVYGTSRTEARERGIDPMVRALEGAFRAEKGAEAPCVMAYTSAKARARLEARGERVPDAAEALEQLWARGVRRAVVADAHLVDGRAYQSVREAADEKAPLFDEVCLSRPLMATAADVEAVARALEDCLPRRDGTSYVLVGHGAEGAGQLAYLALGYALRVRGRDDVLVGLLRGEPSMEDIAAQLDAEDPLPHEVRLVPLMLTAAGHVEHDIEGAWRARFEQTGYAVSVAHEGIGAWPELCRLAVAHMREAPARVRRVGATSQAEAAARGRFPLFVSLVGADCLVVGAGEVGRRRAKALACFGALVTVVDPRVGESMGPCAGIQVRRRPYEAGDEDGRALVVAATDDRSVNRAIGERCRRLGIPVSVADAPDECTFFFPALCENDELVVGITSRDATRGAHAAVSRAASHIRQALERLAIAGGPETF